MADICTKLAELRTELRLELASSVSFTVPMFDDLHSHTRVSPFPSGFER